MPLHKKGILSPAWDPQN